VFLLSDGYLANGAVPWRLPDVASLPDLSDVAMSATEPNHTAPDVSPEYWPYHGTPRPWPGRRHRALGAKTVADASPPLSTSSAR